MWRLNKNDTVSGMKMATRKMLWEVAWALGRWDAQVGQPCPECLHQPGRGVLIPWLLLQVQSSNSGGREIQRTMLELLNQLDGFDSQGDVKVIMATNRIETLDPALIQTRSRAGPRARAAPAPKGRCGEDRSPGDGHEGKYSET